MGGVVQNFEPSKGKYFLAAALRSQSFINSDLVLQVRCRELKRADHVAFPLKGSNMEGEANGSVSAGLSYSIEIKDVYIPPWIICRICATMGSEGRSFEASITSCWLIRIKLHSVCVQFCNEPTSIALNAAVETVGQKSDTQGATGEGIQESTYAFGIPDAVVTSFMHSAFLKGMKYGNGSYHQLVFLLYNILLSSIKWRSNNELLFQVSTICC
ncbi:hypothetical protein CK203_047203 [Vitis vinifera]|uniref:Uncharacterized protein n=1 Tax=Vitis vinifera TaxID=29760 RepID=A0A438HZ70_VITVI|nr:hypothetical protein CK203_047203 [Vitis vinifera]